MMTDNSTFDGGFWKSFGWFIVIALLIFCMPWLLTSFSMLDFSETGQIGDTLGGIMGPFIAMAAAGLTFVAFWVQYKANIQQRHDIAIERFESNLFEMIHIQQEITSELKIMGKDSNNMRVSKEGRDVFQSIYEEVELKSYIENTTRMLTLYRALEISDETKCKMRFMHELWFLDHYFRHLYRIFKYIDEYDETVICKDRKYDYAAIVRATLSPYELVMIFYNGISHPKFKKLIENYAILKNLRYKLLASVEDRTIYSQKFNEDYSFSEDEDREMFLEYKKGAFVRNEKR